MRPDSAAPTAVDQTVTGHGGPPPGQGPFISLQLHLHGAVIQEATYETYQWPGSHACGRALCDLLKGSSLEQARGIRHEALVERVGPLPSHRRHCYGLALLALSDVLGQLKMNEGRG